MKPRLIRVVGVDPAFVNTGICRGFYNIDTDAFEPSSIHLIQTQASKEKNIRKSSDDFARAQFLTHELIDHTVGADVVFVEMPSGSQSARAAKCLGIALGCLTAIEAPIVQLTAGQVKKGAVGDLRASKATMMTWGRTGWPNLEWHHANNDEHMADALGCVVTGVQDPEFIKIKNILKKHTPNL